MSDEQISTDPGLTMDQAVDEISARVGVDEAPTPPPKSKPPKAGSTDEAAERISGTAEPEYEAETVETELPPPQQPLTPNQEVMQARANLRAQANQINWEHLRASDPGEYAAKFQEYKHADEQLSQYESNLNAHQQQQAQHMTQAEIQQHKAELKNQEARLMALLPKWQDPEVRDRETKEMRGYLTKKGYSAAEIDGVTDARSVALIHEAMNEAKPRRRARSGKPMSNAEQQIQKRRIPPHSMEAGALRIAELMNKMKHDELNERQRKFAECYVQNGGNAKEAALAAGYKDSNSTRVTAHKTLKIPKVQAEVERQIRIQLASHGPVALARIKSLMDHSDPRIALKASMDYADRAGLKPTEKKEVTFVDERSDDEIEASIAAAMAELEIDNGSIH